MILIPGALLVVGREALVTLLYSCADLVTSCGDKVDLAPLPVMSVWLAVCCLLIVLPAQLHLGSTCQHKKEGQGDPSTFQGAVAPQAHLHSSSSWSG